MWSTFQGGRNLEQLMCMAVATVVARLFPPPNEGSALDIPSGIP
jgi:hypothetical protein